MGDSFRVSSPFGDPAVLSGECWEEQSCHLRVSGNKGRKKSPIHSPERPNFRYPFHQWTISPCNMGFLNMRSGRISGSTQKSDPGSSQIFTRLWGLESIQDSCRVINSMKSLINYWPYLGTIIVCSLF